jgi:hypothetical protein
MTMDKKNERIEDLTVEEKQAGEVKGGVVDPNDRSVIDPNNRSIVDPNNRSFIDPNVKSFSWG